MYLTKQEKMQYKKYSLNQYENNKINLLYNKFL